MEVFQDNLCFILDLEGFYINKTFYARELGYFTWNQEHGRHAFFVPVSYKTLCDKDKRTVNFVISKIHGLSYQPSQTEHAQNPRILGTLIKDLYQDYSTAERTVVGYKGGHVEKDVLTQLNIPSLNLETVGCPKYDVLKYQTPFQLLIPSCGFHADDSTHHCPVTECSAFWHWYKSEIKICNSNVIKLI